MVTMAQSAATGHCYYYEDLLTGAIPMVTMAQSAATGYCYYYEDL